MRIILILLCVMMIVLNVWQYGRRFEDGIIYERTRIFEQDFSDRGERRRDGMVLGGVHLSEWPRFYDDDYMWFRTNIAPHCNMMRIDWIKHYVVCKTGGEANYYLVKAEYPQEEAQ